MKSIAIIGTGIAGLGCAYKLQNKYQLTLFEQNYYVGGHSHTVIVDDADKQSKIPIDTGFMVFNKSTYPNLTKLFLDLAVPIKNTDMSFSVQMRDPSRREIIEWCGSSLNQLFGQRKNILSRRFWRFIYELNHFNKCVETDFDSPTFSHMTVHDYVKHKGFGDDLSNLYLIPMASAIWSSTPEAMANFPALTLLRFFHNHRLNRGLKNHLDWITVDGGAKEYVSRLTSSFADNIKLGKRAVSISKSKSKIQVETADGETYDFDGVVVATHADQALALLREPSVPETDLLSRFKYSANTVLLHKDNKVMPNTRLCWASWNYRMDNTASGIKYSTHYWMNNLQHVSDNCDYFVSVNSEHLVQPATIIKQINYEHPIFDLDSVKAQDSLPAINNQENQRIFFCGSYFRYGFHEDALNSALNVSGLIINHENL